MNEAPKGPTLSDRMENLKALRDEIHVQLHLAGMEAKAQWKKLEPKISEAERIATHATEASRRMVEQLVEDVKAFSRSIRS